MPSISTAIANGQKQKEKPQNSSSRRIALLGAVVVVLAFGILGVCIATLIRTVQNGQQNDASTPSPVTTTTTTTTATTTTATSTQQTPTSPPPTTLGPLEALHVPMPSKLPLDQTSSKYQAYSNFTQRLAKSLNLSEDPCNNFYDYACGNFSGPMSFDELAEQNINTFLKLIEEESYTKNPKLPLPVKQAIQFHQKCVEAMNDWDAEVGDGTRLRTKMLILENLLDGVPFPAVSDKTQPEMFERPTVEALSIVLGYLSNDEGVDTFVTVGASSNWLEPHGEHPYTLHFDQARLLLPTNYYRKAWNTVYPMLHADLISALKAYAKFVGANVTHEEIEADVREMMEMEVNIATNLVKGPEERRKFAPQSNVYTFERADTEFGEYLDFELFAFWATMVPDGVDPRKVEPFYIHEPKVLKLTMQFLNKLSPRTLYNYLYVRLLYANLNYLPVPHRLSKIPGLLSSHGIGFPNSDNNGISISQLPYDPTELDIGASKDRNRAKCTSINAQYFAFANARVFLDAQLPDKEKRTKLRAQLRTMVAGVVDSFRGMVAQLGWMSNEVKRKSFLKMDNLVTNMAWPDFIEDDDALTAFYSPLQFNEGETFTQMKDKLRAFWVNSRSKRLFFANDTDRLEFGPSAVIVNAWYSPLRNSITFPLGILSRPFYDPNFPASVNYGALGIVAGHELSHGFDDQGVQWDGTGVLSDWMDANSMTNFEEMAQCVVNEYGQFEPLSGMHIDGTMTQGENIADNGGVRAAYKAFQTHVGLYGQDPRLPHDLFGEFTHQQLFFLSFAQVWCERAPDPQEMYMHLLVNPHSPSKYRILGSLQNFPAFRQAFHCPAETKYSPSKHCNVWESESAPAAVGVPPTPSTPHPLNIPTQPTGTDDEYLRAADLFEHSVDTSHDPCDDFYEYSCGRFSNSEQMSFEAAQGTAFSSMLDGLIEPVDAAVDIRPVVLVKELFQQCKNAIPKWRNWTRGAVKARRALEKFRMASGLEFPLFRHGRGSKPMLWPSATKLGNALGYLSGVEGVDTFLTTFVDVDWMEPQTTDGHTYRLHFDQASLALPRPYYTKKAWKWIKESYREEITRLFNDYAAATGLDMKENLWRTVNDILDFEWKVANKLTKADEDRRQYKAMYNPTKLAEANVTFIEMVSFVRALIENARPSHSGRIFNLLLNKPVIFAEPKLFEQYNEAFTKGNISAKQLANYLYYRLLLAYKMFIPSSDGEDEFDKDKMQKKLGGFSDELKGFEPIEMIRPIAEFEKAKNSKKVGDKASVRARMIYRYEWKKPPIGRPTFQKRKRLPSLKNGHYGLLEEYCAFYSVDYLPYANARVLVDQILPGARERDLFRNKFGKFVSSVVDGFKSMLEQLEWIEPSDKRKAIDKAENIVRNIGYADLVTDDRMLNAQMEQLKWRNSTNPNFFEMLEDIELFNSANTWDALLTIGPADRQQFSESPAIVNAWYQPQLNSITFPLALLQPPFFNPGWPDSINYGAIGVVIGHELVHGFDDEGIQWGAVGGLRDWMGAASVGAFRKMADCVVDEFGAFCPLNGTELSPTCIDGSATQGENIADSGGIEAAFRAFRNSLSFYGPNPRLPGGLAGQFSDDQLFFLSFANIWCQRPMDVDEGEEFAQLLLDTHSPPKFRVLGTLRNFPAFRTAFNCPLGKRYAPPETEHCNVWVDEIKAVNGVAPQIAAPPAINVPEWKQSNDGFFTTTANLLAASMDNKKDPCNDFHAYACANFEGPMHFNRAQQQSIFDSLIALFYNLMDIPTTLPKEQSKEFFRKCLDDTTNWRHLTNGSRVVLKHMAKFKSRTRIHFPLMDAAEGKQIAYNWPDPTAMGNALAYLSSNYGSDTLLSTSVDTNWGDDPQGNQPYSLYIDQGALALPQKYYSDPVWTRINQSYVEEVANLLGRYVRASGKQVNETEVRKVAEQIGHFEYTFANHLMTEEERRTNFSRMFNPMKFMEVAQSLSWVDLPIYMQEMLFTAATPEVFERLFQERYSVVVMEPEMLKKTSNAFKHDNPFGFAPAQLFNYLSFRLLLSLSPYFESDSPYSSKVFRNVPEIYVRPPTGRPRWEEPIFDMNEFFGDDQSKTINSNSKTNQFMTLIGCTLSSLEMLPHQTSRLYLDFVLPRERDRLYLRKTVANLVENVVVGFDSMLDQLEWMGKASKKSASEKVSNMVRNIGFPDWIADDQQLNAYSKQFPLIAEDNLIETKFGISNFFLKKALEPLAWKGHTNRTNFNGLPMTVNAWYQPQLNSITFPLAILTPPFFHPNSPTALNYGIFGAIVGHELTHAFDSTGTQFDAFGKLRQWLDPKSMAAFDAMVQCVIYQYGRFCPINEKNGTANCVDGISSRGENVADNGGIRAAYRAYKNAMDYRGADFALPGPLLSQYDHEQLFFLSFAQTWCQPSDAKTHQRLLFDVHPAPEFRLLGSLQNFPAFQNAFHCPKDSLYAPIDHCDVWVSDVKLDNGEHFPPPPSLNIPSREKELSQKFREASEYFEKSVDIGQDPCNNFYEYACNSFEGVGHFDRISIQNLITLTNALKGYRHEQIEPIQKAKLAFQKCNLMMNNYQEALKKADLPREKFFLFQKKSRFDFPIFAGQKLGWPTRDELSTALGALSGSILVDTLISFYVDTNWEDPNSEEMPYALFIDQPTLAFDPANYSPEMFPRVYHLIESFVRNILIEMANYMGVEYAWKDLKAAVQEVIGIERTLANHFLANADSRLNDMGSRFNVFSVSEAQRQFPFLNWSLFLRELAENAPQTVKEKMRQPNFRFAIVEPSLLAKLGNELGPGNSYNITANQLLNYFYFRLILSNSAFMPQGELSKNGTINVPITENWTKRALKFGGHIIKPVSSKDYFFYRPSVGRPRRMEIFAKEKMRKVNAEIFYSEFVCAEYTLAMMDLVSGRLWLDHALPSREMRMNVKNGAKKLVNSILLSFRSMVQQISWMSPRAKSSAHNKLDKIVANIGWPQIMVNNSELEQYYKPLVFTDNENFVNIWEKGMKFAYTRQWQHLLKRHGTDRTEFNEQIILVNAWYQPELNSITVPASILSQPFFDREWPDFINYGTIGAVLGHELSHGFDNLGVQWDSDGSAIKWLDARSQLAFDRMAKCLVDEYSQLCPFPRDGRIQPACIDGNKTQGENIADNGGLHAAFRAYRSALEVDGPSKALPGDLIGRFSPDQLFFMSFAQPWCEEPNEFETFLQLMDDTHSPAKFRVLGSLRNFPAFRDSFNCPLNSKYAPEKHCDVWVSSVTEKPIAAPPANLLNVPTAQMARADDEEFAAYKSAVQYFKNSMNLASDPCNNFYEYACANYRGPTGFAVKQNDNYKRIATAIEQMEPKPDSALEKLKQFFTACTSTLPQLNALILDGAVLRARLDRFIAFTNMDFPLFSVRSSFDMPNGDTLARALAWLSAREGVDTLVTPFVDVELAPSEEGQKGPQNYRLFLDQNTLAFRKSYYQPGTWELIREKYATNAKTLLRRVGHVLGKATDEKVLEEAVQGLLELELRLAREFSTDEEKRMDVGRWAHTLETLDNANRVVPLLDWNTYVKQLTKLSGVNLGDPKKKQFAYFIEGNMMGKLSDALTKKEKDGREVGAVQLANYLFFRLLLQNVQFIPKSKLEKTSNYRSDYAPIFETKEEEEHFLVDQPPLIGGGWRNRRLFQRARWAMEDPFRPIMARRTDGVETICAAQSSNLLGMASARVFADLLYPGGQKQREELRKSVSRMVNGVHHSYRAMLDELDWLDGATRGEAMAKLDQLRVNIGSPDWIHSDGELDSFFDALNFENATDYFNSLDQLTTFNNFLQFRLLQEDKFKVNRNEFMGLPTDVNAWYIPELNSITFPDGILQRPFFDPQWPAAVNYGTLGSIAGHEISHAFDDDGVQWNSEGFLKRWMGDESQKDFDQMAKCVVGEYGAIEVLDPAKYRPSNISGLRTQGENIADNAGIIAAFRAFKLHSALNGPEPRLPDQSLSGLSADQLFFLSFAQNWCQSPPSENELFRQILVDPHSPSKVRVLGTLRNFPAFREAFNCRANSFYAAKKPCHVWVPEMPDF